MDDDLRQVLPLLRPRSGELDWLGQLAGALILALIVGAILAYVYAVWRQRRRSRRAFAAAAFEHRLSAQQVRQLLHLARRQRLRDPLLLLTSLKAFDRLAGRLDADGGTDRELAAIATVRRRLGFDNPAPSQRFYTTRTLAPGQRLLVWPHGGQAGFLRCVVVDRDEHAITAVPLLRDADHALSQLRPGDAIKVRFWRSGDTEYRFRTTILDAEPHSTSIRLRHAEGIERVQLRDYYRAVVDFALRLYLLPAQAEPPAPETLSRIADDVVDGHAMDVSGGGLSVHLPRRLEVDRQVVIDFALEAPLPLAGLRAAIVDVDRRGAGWRHRLQFVDLPSTIRDDLVAAIFAHELHSVAP